MLKNSVTQLWKLFGRHNFSSSASSRVNPCGKSMPSTKSQQEYTIDDVAKILETVNQDSLDKLTQYVTIAGLCCIFCNFLLCFLDSTYQRLVLLN